ncbi:MAG: HEAT repeat domain-containing protein [Methanolinea sp.]|nr:HEAT repeat domain-containing protein [Methanolinea sp.]
MTGQLSGSLEKTRPEIVQSIREMGKNGQPAVDFLIQALTDQDKRVRIAAAHALGEIGDRRCFESLVGMLSDQDKDIRFISAAALGRLGDPRAIEPLSGICTDDYCFVRIAARDALIKLKGITQQPLY